ncbi:hypothetical protein CK203_108249 [Vitis vinifera]|uniref:Reverse transcriptase RNase H-like domain-containing protein n=1 Tax=Vitis vinifera TaxID=29760 RepID=A0A438D006_VITVI|nr:hypothetical protein CK203_108249 [Vitis vinifera]
MGNQRHSIPRPSPKEPKTYLLRQQGIGDVETRYSKMELTALALRSAAQKLRPYFQAHPVIVLTDQPLRNILHKPDLTGRMLQWAIELSEFGIEFQPIIVHERPTSHPTGILLPLTMKQNMRPSCPDWTSPLLYPSPNSGSIATHNLCNSPNGQSKKSSELTIGALTPWPDSCLLPIKEAILLPIHVQPNPSVIEFPPAILLRQTKRTAKNGRMTSHNISRHALYPEMLKQAHKVRVQTARFTLIGGHLYKRSFTGPYLRCLGHSEAQYVLAELHEEYAGIIREDDLWNIELIRKDTIGQQ